MSASRVRPSREILVKHSILPICHIWYTRSLPTLYISTLPTYWEECFFREKTLAIILESNDYSTFDTHTQHTRLFFNECLFHLCDCTCSNVMCILNCLSIKPKTIFEYFICFWKCFCAFVFWVFVQIAFFMFFIKNSFRGIFARNSRLSSSQENGLRQNMKTKNLNKNFCDCFASKVLPQKVLCFKGIFRE